MNEPLNDSNLVLQAMKHYDNPQCHDIKEFEEDMKKIMYLKKLIIRYVQNNDLKERLILNHIIVIYNIFGSEFSTKLLFYRIEKEYWNVLVTFLVYLNRMPEFVPEYGIRLSEIPLDDNIVSQLRKI